MSVKTNAEKSAFFLRKGLYELSHHRPGRSLEFFQKSIALTPAVCGARLSRALYWLSIAMFQLNKRDIAIKSLANAQKLRHRGYARKLYMRHINEYGMLKRPTKELDDLYAFVSIQLSLYLVKRPHNRFASEAERAIDDEPHSRNMEGSYEEG